MRSAASKGFVLVCTFALLIVVVILHFAPRGPTTGSTYAIGGTGTIDPGLADPSRPLTISGGTPESEGSATEPISPGIRAPLDLKFSNPHDFPMSVTDLRVSVQKVSAPNADDAHPCAVSDFTVHQAPSGLQITAAAGSTSTLSRLGIARTKWPQVGMLNRSANQDGCKEASLTLAYTASGTAGQ
jgi:hypothetical protein